MKNYTIQQRAQFYNEKFPNRPPLVWTDRWVYGNWSIGNDYRNKTNYHGAYPHGYLDRVISMFPDVDLFDILHLFSGSLPKSTYTRFDIKQKDIINEGYQQPDIIGDAHHLTDYLAENRFDLILADPQYTDEDGFRYGTPRINRNIVLKECYKVLRPGGYLVWLDMILPMYSNDMWINNCEISLRRSTQHRFRCVEFFQKRYKLNLNLI